MRSKSGAIKYKTENERDGTMNYKKDLLEYLACGHKGSDNAVFSKELEQHFSLDGRSIRRIISKLRQEGIPICSGPNGYYYAGSQQEINDTIARLNDLVTGVSNARTGLLYAQSIQNRPTVEIIIRFEEV